MKLSLENLKTAEADYLAHRYSRSFGMPDSLSDLSESRLLALRASLDAERDFVTDEMIRVGRGHELTSETLQKSDPLSTLFKKVSEDWSALIREERTRKEWHGSLKPIRKRTPANGK